jgi:hypothetical protein
MLFLTYGRELIAPVAARHERPVRTITSIARGRKCIEDKPRAMARVCSVQVHNCCGKTRRETSGTYVTDLRHVRTITSNVRGRRETCVSAGQEGRICGKTRRETSRTYVTDLRPVRTNTANVRDIRVTCVSVRQEGRIVGTSKETCVSAGQEGRICGKTHRETTKNVCR